MSTTKDDDEEEEEFMIKVAGMVAVYVMMMNQVGALMLMLVAAQEDNPRCAKRLRYDSETEEDADSEGDDGDEVGDAYLEEGEKEDSFAEEEEADDDTVDDDGSDVSTGRTKGKGTVRLNRAYGAYKRRKQMRKVESLQDAILEHMAKTTKYADSVVEVIAARQRGWEEALELRAKAAKVVRRLRVEFSNKYPIPVFVRARSSVFKENGQAEFLLSIEDDPKGLELWLDQQTNSPLLAAPCCSTIPIPSYAAM